MRIGPTYADPNTNGTVSLNPKSGMDRRVVRSMATDVEYTLTMLSANFMTRDTAMPLRKKR